MEFDDKEMNKKFYKKYQDIVGKLKKHVIDSYDDIVNTIDIKTEKILKELNLDIENESGELFDKVNDEKQKCLDILEINSRLAIFKNDCFSRLIELKKEYKHSNNENCKNKIIDEKLTELNDCIQLIEEFLEEFKNRAIVFEKNDDLIYQILLL